jgi:TRAP-type C4-dicarboxylate transport system permease small subunit
MQPELASMHSDAASGPTRAVAPRWLTRIDDVFLAVVVILMAILFFCVVAQVVSRYVFESPLPWTEELARYSFIWCSFLTASVIVGRGEHFSIDFLLEALSPRPRWMVRIVSISLCLIFALLMIYYGFGWANRMMIGTSPVLQISQGLVYAIIPLAGLHMALHLTCQLLRAIKNLRSGEGAA